MTWQEEQAAAQKKRAATAKLAAWQFKNKAGLGDAKGRTEPLVFDNGKVPVRFCVVCPWPPRELRALLVTLTAYMAGCVCFVWLCRGSL